MNSLNIITSRVASAPASSTTSSRSNSTSSVGLSIDEEKALDSSGTQITSSTSSTTSPLMLNEVESSKEANSNPDESTPLLGDNKTENIRSTWWHAYPRAAASGILNSIRWVFATLVSPGVYLVACFYDGQGAFAPLRQFMKLIGLSKAGLNEKVAHKDGSDLSDGSSAHNQLSKSSSRTGRASRPSSVSTSSAASSDSEREERKGKRQSRTRGARSPDESSPNRRSIRIKLNNEEAMQERKHQRTQSAVARLKNSEAKNEDILSQIKSPTSPIAALTRYPRTPAPPRPLIPRRQPSYLNLEPSNVPKKTLILDLDETLIHSMSKGGRMSTGHMVEVRLNTASLGVSGQSSVGQHPILYWVNKRPFCDEFLRRVCKWFNLVIFTASVQEYADPVIDWLEQERKFFSARYYRQHCTYRQGAYIKDLSAVEPDLSNVMILDNSPLSYLFHEDNAIPIQGWINDPTDSDLMHLVPLLEGLQYVHDVRALLALRGGEDGQHAG